LKQIVCDIEADGLHPSRIWVIVCKNVFTGDIDVFHPTDDDEKQAFRKYSEDVSLWIGHNFLGYDRPHIARLCDVAIDPASVCDTLVVSRCVDALRPSHSLESWGAELGRPKLHTDLEDWSKWTPELEERCLGDVETNFLLYRHLEKYITSHNWKSCLETEHFIAHLCVSELNKNGFSYDYPKSILLKEEIDNKLLILDNILKSIFLPKVIFLREWCPRLTKFGTISKQSIPRCVGSDLTPFTADAPFSQIEYQEFNPASAQQRVERLNEAGWRPYVKTKGHKEAERDLRSLQRKRRKTDEDKKLIGVLEAKLVDYQTYGWKTNEENLATLPPDAPEGARKLAERLLLASRSSTLQTWMDAVRPSYDDTGAIQEYRVHGTFNHIGAWTHRMSHDKPNMGNVPKFNDTRPETTPYSDQMRALWQARSDRLLVGVDAESIQLRIFGHYINDQEFIDACVKGDKKNGTDPHSVNQRALGHPCKSRDDAKTFIYAWLLGAGIGQVSTILGCTTEEANEANENFLDRYDGLRYLKEKVLPVDAERGYFQGFDGRYVRIYGDDYGSRLHFALAGYLQNGEVVIMKRAAQIWYPKLKTEGIPFWWVNFVHDEFQTETPDDMEIAQYVARTQADAIRQVGDDLKLRCPMAGSVFADHGTVIDPSKPNEKWAIGNNWMDTH